jgi:hypothetical protein
MNFKNPYIKLSINHLIQNPSDLTKLHNFAFLCDKQDHEPFMTISIIDSARTHIDKTDKVIGFIGIDDKTLSVKGGGSLSEAFGKLGYKIVPKRKPIIKIVENYLKEFWS